MWPRKSATSVFRSTWPASNRSNRVSIRSNRSSHIGLSKGRTTTIHRLPSLRKSNRRARAGTRPNSRKHSNLLQEVRSAQAVQCCRNCIVPFLRAILVLRAQRRPRVRAKGQAHFSDVTIDGTYTTVLPVCEPQARAWRLYVPITP